MDDLYDGIKDKMQNPEEVMPSGADWEKFQNYRSKRDQSVNKRSGWMYSAAAAIILLFISNGMWLVADNISSDVSSVVNTRDTIYLTKYIAQEKQAFSESVELTKIDILQEELAQLQATNLLLENRMEQQNVAILQMQEERTLIKDGPMLAAEGQLGHRNSDNASLGEESNKEEVSKSVGLVEIQGTRQSLLLEPKLIDGLVINGIEYSSELPHITSGFKLTIPSRKKSLLQVISPKTFTLNGNVGYLASLQEDVQHGLLADMRATTIFTRNVRAYIGLAFRGTMSKLDLDQAQDEVDFPQVADGDKVKYAVLSTSKVAVNAGLEYLLNISSKWRPYAGIGFGRVVHNTNNYGFEIDSASGVEYSLATEHGVRQKGYNNLLVSLGTDVNMSKRVDLRLGLAYAYALNVDQKPDFAVKAGFYYHL